MLPQFESQEWSGRIASIKGRTVYLNAGKKTGLKVGDLLMVQELGEEILEGDDPVAVSGMTLSCDLI